MRAKLFRNGRSQAVRLPVTCRFEGTEVEVKRDPETGIVSLHPLRSGPFEWLRQRSELLDSDSDASAGFAELFEGASRMLRLSKGIVREAELHARHQCRSGVLRAMFAAA